MGRALGEHTLEWAREQGYRADAIQRGGRVEHPRAVALYRSLGFEVLATIPEGFRHPAEGYVGLLVMHRRL